MGENGEGEYIVYNIVLSFQGDMITRISGVTTLQGTKIPYHYIVHLKLILLI